MRFFYITLVAAVTLLASASAVSTKQNQISEMSPELVARSLAEAQDNAAVKRNLRKYVEEDSLDSLDSFDETEERAKGINVKQLGKFAKAKNAPLPVNFANLNFKMQMKMVEGWSKQKLNLNEFAKKLGLKSVNDVNHRNYPVFKMFEGRFT